MNTNFVQTQEIKNLLDKYFKAVYEGDVTTLKTIFHENASMFGYLGDDKVIGTPKIFFDDLESKASMKSTNTPCTGIIQNIQVSKNIATATLFVDEFFGICAVKDEFHLMKIEDNWKIMCKTFTTI